MQVSISNIAWEKDEEPQLVSDSDSQSAEEENAFVPEEFEQIKAPDTEAKKEENQ